MTRCFMCFNEKEKSGPCPICGAPEIDSPVIANQLLPGTELRERYVIGLAVNSGGFGIVYRAWDTVLRRVVAIKEFFPNEQCNRIPGHIELEIHREQAYEIQLQRFRLEAQALAKFSEHPNIVKVMDCFDETNTSYIVMEYLDGQTLKSLLQRKGTMSYSEAMCIMTPVFEAVKVIHAAGILHRDLSPDNIIITADNRVKLIDFGAARLSSNDNYDIVKRGITPPEQYYGSAKQGAFTDIYSLGATLYEMLTGTQMEEALDRSADFSDMPEVSADCPENAKQAIMRALAIAPEQRFKSVAAFETALNGKAVRGPKKEKRRRISLYAGLGSVFMLCCIAALIVWHFRVDRTPAIANLITSDMTLDIWLIRDEDNPEQQEAAWNAVEAIFANWLTQQGVQQEIKLKLQSHPENEYRKLLLRDQPVIFQAPDYGDDISSMAADLGLTWQLTSTDVNFFYERMTQDFNGRQFAPLSFDVGAIYYRQQGNGLEASVKNLSIEQLVEQEALVGIAPGSYALLASANGVSLSEGERAQQLFEPLLNACYEPKIKDEITSDAFLEHYAQMWLKAGQPVQDSIMDSLLRQWQALADYDKQAGQTVLTRENFIKYQVDQSKKNLENSKEALKKQFQEMAGNASVLTRDAYVAYYSKFTQISAENSSMDINAILAQQWQELDDYARGIGEDLTLETYASYFTSKNNLEAKLQKEWTVIAGSGSLANRSAVPLDQFLNGKIDCYIGGLSNLVAISNRIPMKFSIEAMPGTSKKLTGHYTNVFCVTKNRSKAEQNAAMIFLAYLYDAGVQDTLFLQGQHRDLPLNPIALRNYADTLRGCDFFSVEAIQSPRNFEMLTEKHTAALAADARLSKYIYSAEPWSLEQALAALKGNAAAAAQTTTTEPLVATTPPSTMTSPTTIPNATTEEPDEPSENGNAIADWIDRILGGGMTTSEN